MVITLFSSPPTIFSDPVNVVPLNFQAGAAPALPANTALSISAASAAPRKMLVAFDFIVSSLLSCRFALRIEFIVFFHRVSRSDVDRVVQFRNVFARGVRQARGGGG